MSAAMHAAEKLPQAKCPISRHRFQDLGHVPDVRWKFNPGVRQPNLESGLVYSIERGAFVAIVGEAQTPYNLPPQRQMSD